MIPSTSSRRASLDRFFFDLPNPSPATRPERIRVPPSRQSSAGGAGGQFAIQSRSIPGLSHEHEDSRILVLQPCGTSMHSRSEPAFRSSWSSRERPGFQGLSAIFSMSHTPTGYRCPCDRRRNFSARTEQVAQQGSGRKAVCTLSRGFRKNSADGQREAAPVLPRFVGRGCPSGNEEC
jgi:hypothetical protein